MTARAREEIYKKLEQRFTAIAPLPGLDLSPLILGQSDALVEADGQPRRGVLFITSDEITAPFPPSNDPHEVQSQQEFAIYQKAVQVVTHGTPQHAPVRLTPGPVCQPNNIHAVRTDRYKLARTFDSSGAVSQQWELYDLKMDPNEVHNLADLNATPPVPNTNLPAWTNTKELAAVLADLDALLKSLEQRCCSRGANASLRFQPLHPRSRRPSPCRSRCASHPSQEAGGTISRAEGRAKSTLRHPSTRKVVTHPAHVAAWE